MKPKLIFKQAKKSFILTLSLCNFFFQYGCAPLGYPTYFSPEKTTIESKNLINMPFEKAWDEYISKLNQEDLVINSISEKTRTINLSITNSDPSEYVDCGKYKGETSVDIYNDAAWVTTPEKYDFKLSDDAKFRYVCSRYPYYEGYVVFWKTSLDSTINVIMTPIGNNTEISINASYILNVEANYVEERIYRLEADYSDYSDYWCCQNRAPEAISFSFHTNNVGTKPFNIDGNEYQMTCQSNGKIESYLRNLIH